VTGQIEFFDEFLEIDSERVNLFSKPFSQLYLFGALGKNTQFEIDCYQPASSFR